MLKIKQIRKLKNLSQDQLAEKTSISKRMLVEYENEKIDIPLRKLRDIAQALEVSILDLLDIANDNSIEKLNEHFKMVAEPGDEYSVEKALRETIAILKNDVAEERKTNDFLKKVIESKLIT